MQPKRCPYYAQANVQQVDEMGLPLGPVHTRKLWCSKWCSDGRTHVGDHDFRMSDEERARPDGPGVG